MAAAPWLPPRLPGTPDAVALWNALVSHLGQPIRLRGQAAAAAALGEAPPADALCLVLAFSAGPRVVMRPVAFPFAATFDADLTIEDLPLLPEALRDALLAGLVATFAAVLPEPGLGAVEMQGAGSLSDLVPAPVARGLRWFRVTVQGAAAELTYLDLGLSLETIAQVFGGGLGLRPVWPGLTTSLTRDVAITLGRLWLGHDEVGRLVPGTVVLLDAAAGAGLLRLRLDDDLFHFQPQERGWACAAITPASARHTGRIMDTHQPTPAPHGGDVPHRLDVAVDLDLGSVTVPLAEIEAWQVGSVVALQAPAPQEGVEVALRVNGRVVGSGELVRIDDRLAVRIARLALA